MSTKGVQIKGTGRAAGYARSVAAARNSAPFVGVLLEPVRFSRVLTRDQVPEGRTNGAASQTAPMRPPPGLVENPGVKRSARPCWLSVGTSRWSASGPVQDDFDLGGSFRA